METNGSSNSRIVSHAERRAQLLPQCPLPAISPIHAGYYSKNILGSNCIPNYVEGCSPLQRTSSENFLTEEQPFWFDELLNEPETPLHRGHRRSSSDSFAYLNTEAKTSNTEEEHKFTHIIAEPSWVSQNFDHYKDLQPFNPKSSSVNKPKNRVCKSSLNIAPHSTGFPYERNGFSLQDSGLSCASQEPDGITSTDAGKQEQARSSLHILECSSEKNDSKPSMTGTDPKRAKQQFAHRSRVRKLQYIAELERYVHVLKAQGFVVSAELEFLDQQNLILGMENTALKQRLDNLTQEQLIKYLERDMLEKEIGRLQNLYQQQQLPQQQHCTHRQAKIQDLSSQCANLPIKHEEASSSGMQSVTN
ncbi:uncharacterized protein At4g06598-like [Malania oleifera]|uniref:uncharacterized protein At4g06598-like n=1 Tax=Malania oleifera TaxID=397392 RepID=UPI0025AEC572|nr:uncharacterized protein At4g06598-like [Malania oleifera]